MQSENVINLGLTISLGGSNADELDDALLDLKNELREMPDLDLKPEQMSASSDGTKGIDPVTLGALLIAVSPPVLTQLIGLINDWAKRREGRVAKIKYQNKDGSSVEVEFPLTLSKSELEAWINLIKKEASKKSK